MRTVLVCVRTPLAAQNVASAAARLGLSPAVRTAVSDPEVMLRLAERPADVVLADTALTRPDSVGFTRRVLARSPGAAVVLFGTEDPGVAAAAVAAGARGLIQGGDCDVVSAVAKAMLLLSAPSRTTRPAGQHRTPETGPAVPSRPGIGSPSTGAGPAGVVGLPGAAPAPAANSNGPAAAAGSPAGERTDGASTNGTPTSGAPRSSAPTSGGPTPAAGGAAEPAGSAVVPAQRGDDVPEGRTEADAADPRSNAAPETRFNGNRRPDTNGYGRASAAGGSRRISLTEREMQVLVGMADGKSNAEIGRELFVSEDTVKTHARRLFRKLGARDRAHAVAAGFRAGLVA